MKRPHPVATMGAAALLGTAAFADSDQSTSHPGATEESRLVVTGFARSLFIEHDAENAFHRYFSAHLIQHDPEIGDGNHGDDDFLTKRRKAHPQKYLAPDQYATVVDNLFADGDLVAIKSHVYTNPQDRGRVFVDIWRVSGGQFVEHWDVIQAVPEHSLNDAGMWCGKAKTYAQARQAGDTVSRPTCGASGPAAHRAAALATVKAYTTMGEQPGRAAEAVRTYVADDFVQHSPHIPQGKQGLVTYFESRAKERVADGRKSEIARYLTDGDFVLMHRRVTSKSNLIGWAYADIYRVRDGKVVEHWDVIQAIPTYSVAGHSMVDGALEPGRKLGRSPAIEK